MGWRICILRYVDLLIFPNQGSLIAGLSTRRANYAVAPDISLHFQFMAKHTSKYGLRLHKRRSAGLVYFQFPVDRAGLMTLNRQDMARDNGNIRTRGFSRLRRADEIE